MKEITSIAYDKKSEKYIVTSFDEDTGWLYEEYDNIEAMTDFIKNNYDVVNFETFDVNQKNQILDLIRNDDFKQMLEMPKSVEEAIILPQDYDYFRKYRVFYITDIHLDSKIIVHCANPSISEVKEVIHNIVSNIVKDFNPIGHNIILIGGDVSHNYDYSCYFYEELIKYIDCRAILAILGNHEYWDERKYDAESNPVDSISTAYANFFDKHCIAYADNMLFSYRNGHRYFVREEEILNATIDEIREFVLDGDFTLLGGTGFSGLNESLNCTNGIYRSALTSRSEEIKRSKRFELIYRKILEAVPLSKIVVFTHMPVDCWTNEDYNPNWIYVNGHTHRNVLKLDGCEVYSNNQIGYGGSVHLKSFFVGMTTNIFKYYPDGIHNITAEQYNDFYRHLKINTSSNRRGQRVMIKRDGIYCFFIITSYGTHLLNGGSIKKIHKDFDYYYQNIPKYAATLKSIYEPYHEKLIRISNFIKEIGGYGRIHGSIVDIDSFRHVFLNPFDGKITPYYAENIVFKRIYKDFKELLKSKSENMYLNYEKLIQKNDSVAIAIKNTSFDDDLYLETDIYKVSNFFKSLQYMSDYFIIRRWDDILISENTQNDILQFLSRCLNE